MPEERANWLRAVMEREFPEAEVTGFEQLIDAMPNDPKDRRVATAAVGPARKSVLGAPPRSGS
ncbi:MAG: hypothetical protein KF764_01815 [Labilithrix sp.]|nr:hypothetical protein [Labilithrix sp.]